MSGLRGGIVALVASVLVPSSAGAADIPLIRVFPPACEAGPVSIDDFVDALRVELAGRQPHCCVVGPSGDATPDAVKVTLAIAPCEPATEQVEVAVEVAAPPRTMQRQVSLADLPPEARPRAMALAVAELIRAAAEPAPPETPPPAPAPATRGAAAFGERIDVNGDVAGELRHFFGHDTTLWGARLGMAVASGRWRASIDAGAASNRTPVEDGDVSLLLVSGALFAGPRFVTGPVVTTFGPAGTLGWARIKGQAGASGVTAREGSGLVATLGVRAAVEGPATWVVRLFVGAEGGLTLRRLDADADGAPVAGISGPYVTLAAGLRFGPAP